jgi:nicotinate phosphoribosyltransferase
VDSRLRYLSDRREKLQTVLPSIKSGDNTSNRDLSDRLFWIPTQEEIKDAITTDVYFEYGDDALASAGINPIVTMEVYTRSNPFSSNWAVLCGIYEVAKLLEGLPIDVDAMEEGEVFLVDPHDALYEPVMRIRGHYRDFARYENPILGFLCQSSGICTKASRVSLLAEGKLNISFGTRRAHPALAAMIERSSVIGGLNSVSNVLGARLLKRKAAGTMPHAFILCVGDEASAWTIFDKALPKDVPRIALVDTLSDEKFGSIKAFETLGDHLEGVRLDTPGSRRGDMKRIVQEVRWELNLRGGKNVKIIVSGGLDEQSIIDLRDYVDGFGIGTSVSTAPVIDFGGKIVEVEGKDGKMNPISKRGDLSGRKYVYRNPRTFEDLVTLERSTPPKGHIPLLNSLIRNGKIVKNFASIDEIQKRTKRLVKKVSSSPSARLYLR